METLLQEFLNDKFVENFDTPDMADEKKKDTDKKYNFFLFTWIRQLNEGMRANLYELYELSTIFLFLMEGIMAGTVISSGEDLSFGVRLTWHIVIAAVCILSGISFISQWEKLSNFIRQRKDWTIASSTFIILASSLLFVVMLGAALLGPAITFLLMASLTESMDAVIYCINTHGILNIPEWFHAFEGNPAIVSTYLGTIFHYFGILFLILMSAQNIKKNSKSYIDAQKKDKPKTPPKSPTPKKPPTGPKKPPKDPASAASKKPSGTRTRPKKPGS